MRVFPILLLAFIFTVSGCSEKTAKQTIRDEIKEEIGYSVIVPTFESYVMNYISVDYPRIGDDKTLRIGYTTEKDNFPELTKSEKKTIRENLNQNVLFGNPKSKNDFFIEIHEGNSKMVNSEIKTISGKQVHYYINDKNARYTILTDKSSYILNVIFNNGKDEATAFDITKQLVKQLKE